MGKKKAAKPTSDPVQQHVCERVREMRRQKGWTLEELSSASGVSRSMISQIERGSANPTLGVAHRLASAFGLTLGALVDTTTNAPQIDVVRSGEPTHLFRDDQHCRIRTLSPLHLEKGVEFYELVMHAGGILDSAPHFHGTREFITVESGHLRITSGGDIVELKKGDSAHYPADQPHKIENLAKTSSIAFLVEIYGKVMG